MDTYLFIAEKPSLAQAVKDCYAAHKQVIEDQVGRIRFTSLSGHAIGYLAPNEYRQWEKKAWKDVDYPMVPEPFKMKAIPGQEKKLTAIKTALSSCNGIIVGTDSDVEGYGIYYLIEHYLGLEKIKTLRFVEHSLTDQEILTSLLSMTDYHTDPVHKAQTEAYLIRSKADWLFGMNATRMMTVKKGTLLRIGRVKAPTLKLVYDNSMAIDHFVPKKYYQVKAEYKDSVTPAFTATLWDPETKRAKSFDTPPDITGIPRSGILTKKKVERVTEHAPKLFDLTVLQAEAGRVYHYTPSDTLDTVQSLYEKHKVISYPRTQCQYVSEEKAKEFPMMLHHMLAFPDLAALVKTITKEDIARVMKDSLVVNNKEVEKESHDALLPTSIRANPAAMTEKERNICHLIYARLLAQFLPQFSALKTELWIDHAGNCFYTAGKIVEEQGFKVLFGQAKEALLPDVKEGQSLFADSISVKEGMTTPPKRLTQASLIHAMKNIAGQISDEKLRASLADSLGIGTPATRAAIIKELIVSGYMEDKKGGLYITSSGKTYIQALSGIPITDPAFAAKLDVLIKEVGHREKDLDTAYEEVLQTLYQVCGLMGGAA